MNQIGRKLLHISFGLLFLILLDLNLISALDLFYLLIISSLLSILQKYYSIPILTYFIKHFGKPEETKFIGKGFILFVVGFILALKLFPRNIALASLSILTFGDSTSQIFSDLFPKYQIKVHKAKSVVGFLISILISTGAASYFVPLKYAIAGVLSSITLELFEIKIEDSILDDNVMIPLVSGTAMFLLLYNL